MGVHANLYNSSGNVVKTTNWQYNTRTTDFHSASTKMHNVKELIIHKVLLKHIMVAVIKQ
ncbi:hypothetical protein KK423_19250 [Clostridioides difficile]|nr:hypothetical protein [Clostridioides difficile]